MSGSFVTILQLSALYFAAVAIGSAIIGQHVVGKVIKAIGRASLIIFILAFTIFVSAMTLGMLMCPYIFSKEFRTPRWWCPNGTRDDMQPVCRTATLAPQFHVLSTFTYAATFSWIFC